MQREVPEETLEDLLAAYRAETDSLKRRELARRVQQAAEKLQDALRERGVVR